MGVLMEEFQRECTEQLKRLETTRDCAEREKLHVKIGDSFLRLANYAKAREHYKQALELEKKRVEKDNQIYTPSHRLCTLLDMLSTSRWSEELDDTFRKGIVAFLNSDWQNPSRLDFTDESVLPYCESAKYHLEGFTCRASAKISKSDGITEYRIYIGVPKRLLRTVDVNELSLANLPVVCRHIKYFFDDCSSDDEDEQGGHIVSEEHCVMEDGSLEMRFSDVHVKNFRFVIQFSHLAK